MCQQTCCAEGYKRPRIAALSWSFEDSMFLGAWKHTAVPLGVTGCVPSHCCRADSPPMAAEEMLQSLEDDSLCPAHSSLKLTHIWDNGCRWKIEVQLGTMLNGLCCLLLDCQVGMEIEPPERARSFPAHFSPSNCSKEKHLWMSLPEAITSTWQTWLSKPIGFTSGKRWAAYIAISCVLQGRCSLSSPLRFHITNCKMTSWPQLSF